MNKGAQTGSSEKWVEILRRAAVRGKQSIVANYNPKSRYSVLSRGFGGDLTLQIDKRSEDAIYRSLVGDLGQDSFVFVSEEVGERKTKDDSPRPIIFCDPLDGSHNAQVGVPLFSVSLAILGLRRKIPPSGSRSFADIDIGFIQSVPTSDEYYGIRGSGSFHNREKIQIGSPRARKRFETLGVECGNIDYLKSIISKVDDTDVYKLRVLGSAALAYCFLSDGAFDGFAFVQSNGARTIDSPAGYLIARESGCMFSDLSGKDLSSVEVGFESRINIIGARNRKMHSRLLSLLS